MLRRITTKAEIIALARELQMRSDWHEPDEVGVSAETRGTSFDNAGFWPEYGNMSIVEQHVILKKDGEPVAAVNLATLFSWASQPPVAVTSVTEESVVVQGVRYYRRKNG